MNIALLILGMALVTYLPRVLPAFIIDRIKLSGRLGKFINLIPITAMTALIVPGVFSVDASRWYIGAIGGLVAVCLACIKKMPSTVVVLASVGAVMLMYVII